MSVATISGFTPASRFSRVSRMCRESRGMPGTTRRPSSMCRGVMPSPAPYSRMRSSRPAGNIRWTFLHTGRDLEELTGEDMPRRISLRRDSSQRGSPSVRAPTHSLPRSASAASQRACQPSPGWVNSQSRILAAPARRRVPGATPRLYVLCGQAGRVGSRARTSSRLSRSCGPMRSSSAFRSCSTNSARGGVGPVPARRTELAPAGCLAGHAAPPPGPTRSGR